MTWGEIRQQVFLKHPTRSFDEINAWISEGYDSLLLERDWLLLKSSYKIPTPAAYSTGTAAVTNGSATVTGTGTTWTLQMEQDQRSIRFGSDTETYKFTWVSATELTLDRVYQGTTSATAGYMVIQREFILSADVRILRKVYNPRLSKEPMKEKRRSELLAREIVLGEPCYYALDLAGETDPFYQRIIVEPIPQVAGELIVDYVSLTDGFNGSNLAISPMPWVNPWAIVHHAQALGFPAGSAERSGLLDEAAAQSSRMHRDENLRTPPTKFKPASRYTRHERNRLR